MLEDAKDTGDQPGTSDEDEDDGSGVEKQKPKAVAAKKEPKNKSELFAAYSGQGPVKMVQDFLAGRDLFHSAHVILIISAPLEAEFYADQKSQNDRGFSAWAAKRARGTSHWWNTTLETVHQAFSAELREKVGLPAAMPRREVARNDPSSQKELRLMEKAMAFACHLGGNHTWANLQYQYVLPHAMPAYLISDDAGRRAGVSRLQSITLAVVKLEAHLKSLESKKTVSGRAKRLPSELANLVRDLAWNRQQLARECMGYAAQTNFRPGANPPRKLARRWVEASHSTWGVMESTFAHLRSRSAFTTKAAKMADFTKYALTLAAPYAKKSGLQPILPDVQDWLQAFSPELLPLRNELMRKLVSVNATTMPKPEMKTAKALLNFSKGWKKAGPLSQQRAAAATYYVVQGAADNWCHVNQAWGCGVSAVTQRHCCVIMFCDSFNFNITVSTQSSRVAGVFCELDKT